MPLSINALKDRVTQLEGRVYFGNAQRVGEKMRRLIEDATPKVVVLDCSALTDLEYTALTMLTDADERLRRDGVTLWLAALNPDVRHVVEHAPLGEVLGRERMLFNLESAMARYQQWERRATRHPE